MNCGAGSIDLNSSYGRSNPSSKSRITANQARIVRYCLFDPDMRDIDQLRQLCGLPLLALVSQIVAPSTVNAAPS